MLTLRTLQATTSTLTPLPATSVPRVRTILWMDGSSFTCSNRARTLPTEGPGRLIHGKRPPVGVLGAENVSLNELGSTQRMVGRWAVLHASGATDVEAGAQLVWVGDPHEVAFEDVYSSCRNPVGDQLRPLRQSRRSVEVV